MTEAPQAPAPAPAPGGPAPNPGKGLCIGGMVLGIVAVVLCCLWYISVPCGIVGLILNIMGKKKAKAAGAPTGTATAGMVLSIIGLALGVIVGLIFGAFFLAMLGFGEAAKAAIENMPNTPMELLDLIPIL